MSAPSDDELLSADRVIRWAEGPSFRLSESTLSTRETALIDFLRADANQNLTASEILSRSPLSDAETRQILASLIAIGVLELGAVGAESQARPHLETEPIPVKLGRFEVERVLGRGSMGAVLLAKDPAIDRVVAIKLVQMASHLTTAQREKYRDRFYREAAAAGQLLHPAIATVYDVGHTDDGTPFLVMELVKGETLGELLERGRPSLAETVRIAGDVLEALSFAHARGIVHRDVKPSNIMVTADRHAKIMDFGIAHVMGSELTAGVELLGSPYYMAPEQLSKGPISARTDLFSFAVVLYRMLTGILPFTGDSFAAVAHAILHEKPVAPHRVDASIPRPVSELVLKCLEKSPPSRAASASEVLRALDARDSSTLDSSSNRKRNPKQRVIRFAVPAGLVLALFAAVRLADLVADENPESIPQVVAPSSSPVSLPLDERQPAPLREVPTPPASPAPANSSATATPPFPSAVEPGPAELEAPEPVRPKPERTKRVVPPPAAPEPRTNSPSEADLFYEAQLAAERGEPERSRQLLDRLLERNPGFSGASDLYVAVTDQIWERSLPLKFPARHRHRVGGCDGELSLASLGVRFESAEHELAFRPEDIRVMERPEKTEFFVETFEKDLLALGKNKRYRFELENPLGESDWVRYQRLLK